MELFSTPTSPHSNRQVEKAVRMVNDFSHIKAFYDIILDSPWDTDKDTIETLMFLSKLPTPFQLYSRTQIQQFFPSSLETFHYFFSIFHKEPLSLKKNNLPVPG